MLFKKTAGLLIAMTFGFLILAAVAGIWAFKYVYPVAAPINGALFPEVLPMQTVQVFFSNTVKDPDMMDCSRVYVVDRRIVNTQAVGLAALKELLKGPTSAEKADGYFTSINPGVAIKSLSITDGVARVDFDEKMDEGMGGSCRVTNIRSQIEKTLMQFPMVKSVVISVEGNSEEALQP